MAGRMMCFHDPVPDVGSHPRCTEKMMISMMASQNWGTTMPKTDIPVARLSRIEPRFSAAIIPKGSPATTPMAAESSPSRRLLGKRSMMSCVAGMLYRKE